MGDRAPSKACFKPFDSSTPESTHRMTAVHEKQGVVTHTTSLSVTHRVEVAGWGKDDRSIAQSRAATQDINLTAVAAVGGLLRVQLDHANPHGDPDSSGSCLTHACSHYSIPGSRDKRGPGSRRASGLAPGQRNMNLRPSLLISLIWH